jgi:hypothetical protein
MSLRQSLIHGCDNIFVRQHRVGVYQLAFAKIADFLRDPFVA